jgi:hypothetical protein
LGGNTGEASDAAYGAGQAGGAGCGGWGGRRRDGWHRAVRRRLAQERAATDGTRRRRTGMRQGTARGGFLLTCCSPPRSLHRPPQRASSARASGCLLPFFSPGQLLPFFLASSGRNIARRSSRLCATAGQPPAARHGLLLVGAADGGRPHDADAGAGACQRRLASPPPACYPTPVRRPPPSVSAPWSEALGEVPLAIFLAAPSLAIFFLHRDCLMKCLY